jgi:hypothetical protein
MKSIFFAAVIAAACSGVAMAGELKQDQKTGAPGLKATQMSDFEMDKVTAGGLHEINIDQGLNAGSWVVGGHGAKGGGCGSGPNGHGTC